MPNVSEKPVDGDEGDAEELAHASTRASEKKLTDKARRFLAAYARIGVIKDAAEMTGVTRSAHYGWMRDEHYARCFAEAREDWIESLESELQRRALDEKMKFTHIYLLALLRANKPEKWREKWEQGDESKAAAPTSIVFFNVPSEPKNGTASE